MAVCELITKPVSSSWAGSQTSSPSLPYSQAWLSGHILANGMRAKKRATSRPGPRALPPQDFHALSSLLAAAEEPSELGRLVPRMEGDLGPEPWLGGELPSDLLLWTEQEVNIYGI